MKDRDIWVFLSHSNEDFEKVRIVRNLLEENGFKPIMFYLKCMEDPDKKDLLWQLICDEIDHRNKFIYCKSKNAENSHYVQMEIEHLKETNRTYETIDIEKDRSAIEPIIKEYRHKSLVFISYSRRDSDIARMILERLKKYDSISPWIDYEGIDIGWNFEQAIRSAIKEAQENGYFIALLTDNYIKSSYAINELAEACNNNKERVIILSTVDNDLILKNAPVLYFEICDLPIIKISPDKTTMADNWVHEILKRILSPGDILAYANQFRERNRDVEEADKLFNLYRDIKKDMG